VEKSWDAEDSIPPGDGLLGLWVPLTWNGPRIQRRASSYAAGGFKFVIGNW